MPNTLAKLSAWFQRQRELHHLGREEEDQESLQGLLDAVDNIHIERLNYGTFGNSRAFIEPIVEQEDVFPAARPFPSEYVLTPVFLENHRHLSPNFFNWVRARIGRPPRVVRSWYVRYERDRITLWLGILLGPLDTFERIYPVVALKHIDRSRPKRKSCLCFKLFNRKQGSGDEDFTPSYAEVCEHLWKTSGIKLRTSSSQESFKSSKSIIPWRPDLDDSAF